jgi:hypothetical protein
MQTTNFQNSLFSHASIYLNFIGTLYFSKTNVKYSKRKTNKKNIFFTIKYEYEQRNYLAFERLRSSNRRPTIVGGNAKS